MPKVLYLWIWLRSRLHPTCPPHHPHCHCHGCCIPAPWCPGALSPARPSSRLLSAPCLSTWKCSGLSVLSQVLPSLPRTSTRPYVVGGPKDVRVLGSRPNQSEDNLMTHVWSCSSYDRWTWCGLSYNWLGLGIGESG